MTFMTFLTLDHQVRVIKVIIFFLSKNEKS
jgi:hypothetical protein